MSALDICYHGNGNHNENNLITQIETARLRASAITFLKFSIWFS